MGKGMSLKRSLIRALMRRSWSRDLFLGFRSQYHRIRRLPYFLHDLRRVYKYMHWDSPESRARYWVTSSSLLFQYHKLEKGLCIPGPKRAFGADPATATIEILSQWRDNRFKTADPVYRGAIETLRAYRERLSETPLNGRPEVDAAIAEELALASDVLEAGHPRPVNQGCRDEMFRVLGKMAAERRSVRSFLPEPVPRSSVDEALRIAQLSPSACNRQPCKVHLFSKRTDIDAMLAFQNGNRGFGQTIPTLLVVTADTRGFFDASERSQPHVDGGLFSMSLLYALHAQGISSCCLNWCVSPADDVGAHRRGSIPDSEAIIMYIAIGFAATDARAARSPRRSIDSILYVH